MQHLPAMTLQTFGSPSDLWGTGLMAQLVQQITKGVAGNDDEKNAAIPDCAIQVGSDGQIVWKIGSGQVTLVATVLA